MDATMVKDYEHRLTLLEAGCAALNARLGNLEQAEAQRASDREQARLRELAELRAAADAALRGDTGHAN